MNKQPAMTDERFVCRVGAVFVSGQAVRRAAREIDERITGEPVQVRVLRPDDPRESSKLEPESPRIAATLVRTHLVFGLLGGVLGAVLAGVLIAAGPVLFAASPWASVAVLAAFGAVAGLLLAGLASLRPDRDRLTMKLEEAVRAGRWGLVVHLTDERRTDDARAILRAQQGEVIGSP